MRPALHVAMILLCAAALFGGCEGTGAGTSIDGPSDHGPADDGITVETDTSGVFRYLRSRNEVLLVYDSTDPGWAGPAYLP